jgi:SAM-dependent methyltransferase
MPAGLGGTAVPPATLEPARLAAAYARRAVRSDRYAWEAPGQLFLLQGIEREVLSALRRAGCVPLESRDVLEVGCGPGYWLRALLQWGAAPERLAGVDLLPDRVAAARRRCPRAVRLECADAARLPFAGAAFDLVLQFTVLSSVLDADARRAIAAEMLRVLRPGGTILWYDFRLGDPRNADVRGIGRRELRALFPDCDVAARRVTLAPPIARRLADRTWLLCLLLAQVPLLCTHELAVVRPRAEADRVAR